jgi:hypothetical protein
VISCWAPVFGPAGYPGVGLFLGGRDVQRADAHAAHSISSAVPQLCGCPMGSGVPGTTRCGLCAMRVLPAAGRGHVQLPAQALCWGWRLAVLPRLWRKCRVHSCQCVQ